MKKNFAILAAGLAVLALIAGAFHLLLTRVGSRDLRQAQSALRQDGAPLNWADLLATGPVSPPHPALALLHRNGDSKAEYLPAVHTLTNSPSFTDLTQYSEHQQAQVAALLRSPELQALFSALGQPPTPTTHWPPTGTAASTPSPTTATPWAATADLPDYQTAAKLLSLRVLVTAQASTLEPAFRALLEALQVTGQLATRPDIAAHLTRLEAEGRLLTMLQTIATGRDLPTNATPALLHALQTRLQQKSPWVRMVDGERLSAGGWLHAQIRAGNHPALAPLLGWPTAPGVKTRLALFRLREQADADLAAYGDLMRTMRRDLQGPVHVALRQPAPRGASVPRYAALTAATRPATRDLARQIAAYEARLAVVTTGLALRWYAQQHEGYPESLVALGPDLLAQPPTDPYTGAPLTYRRVPGGFRVYSVGPNGQDDEGWAASAKRPEADDLGWRESTSRARIYLLGR